MRLSPLEDAEVLDLSLAGLARLVWRHYRENVVARRLWRRVRPWAFALLAVEAIPQALALLQPSPTTFGTAFFLYQGFFCFFGLVQIALWIGLPIVYMT